MITKNWEICQEVETRYYEKIENGDGVTFAWDATTPERARALNADDAASHTTKTTTTTFHPRRRGWRGVCDGEQLFAVM